MDSSQSPIACARLASALTMDEAAAITGMSKSTYAHREEHPLELTLGELKALSTELNKDGVNLLRSWTSLLLTNGCEAELEKIVSNNRPFDLEESAQSCSEGQES